MPLPKNIQPRKVAVTGISKQAILSLRNGKSVVGSNSDSQKDFVTLIESYVPTVTAVFLFLVIAM